MMGVQWHLQYLENIVIPPHLAKYPQATTSLFIFILIIWTLELDSNWNTMQQVRILVTLCLEQRNRTYKLEFFKACLVDLATSQLKSPLQPYTACLSHGVQFSQYFCQRNQKKWANQDFAVPIISFM